MTRYLLLLFFSVYSIFANAQPKTYSTGNAHSHNDYENAIPFYLAYNNDFGSIEADVFSINDTLFVAHNKQDIRSGRTLRNLYIIPLVHALDSNKHRKLILLVDVKDDYKITLPLLDKELGPVRKFMSNASNNNQLTIVISGNRPSPGEYNNYPLTFFFDDDLKIYHNKDQWKRVGLVSLPFYRISRWNGKDRLSEADSLALSHTIDSVHTMGKQIRFWAAPDNQLSWQTQMNLKVDLIGTDKISELAEFLNSKQRKRLAPLSKNKS